MERLRGVFIEDEDTNDTTYFWKIKKNVTHLVANGGWTYKVLEALSTNRPIVSIDWIEECEK